MKSIATTETTAYLRSNRGLLKIGGNDRLKFLNAITTSDVKALNPGSFQKSCILNPKGKILFEFNLMCFEDFLFLETDVQKIDSLVSFLVKYRMASQVTFENQSENINQWIVFNDDNIGDGFRFKSMLFPQSTSVFVNKRQSVEMESMRKLNLEDFERFRVCQGIPIYGKDIGEDTIIAEVPYFQDAISYTKGCYPGQEIIARLASRGGNVSKRLMGVEVMDTQGLKNKEVDVIYQGEVVGRLTSGTYIIEASNRYIGMGLIHRKAFEPGTIVELAHPDGEKVTGQIRSLSLHSSDTQKRGAPKLEVK